MGVTIQNGAWKRNIPWSFVSDGLMDSFGLTSTGAESLKEKLLVKHDKGTKKISRPYNSYIPISPPIPSDIKKYETVEWSSPDEFAEITDEDIENAKMSFANMGLDVFNFQKRKKRKSTKRKSTKRKSTKRKMRSSSRKSRSRK